MIHTMTDNQKMNGSAFLNQIDRNTISEGMFYTLAVGIHFYWSFSTDRTDLDGILIRDDHWRLSSWLPCSLRSDDIRRNIMRKYRSTEWRIVPGRSCWRTDNNTITHDRNMIFWKQTKIDMEHLSIPCFDIKFVECYKFLPVDRTLQEWITCKGKLFFAFENRNWIHQKSLGTIINPEKYYFFTIKKMNGFEKCPISTKNDDRIFWSFLDQFLEFFTRNDLSKNWIFFVFERIIRQSSFSKMFDFKSHRLSIEKFLEKKNICIQK